MIRENTIKEIIKDKDVLDVGSTGQTNEYNLFNFMKKYAKTIKGIDLTSSKDPDIIHGDMTRYSFKKKFDVIVLGDIIEHTTNQGLLLDNVKKHLKSDGDLIITTPNAKWPTVFLKPNPTHTLWHDIFTLDRILTLHDFKIVEYKYYYGNKKNYNFIKKILALRQSLLLICKLK